MSISYFLDSLPLKIRLPNGELYTEMLYNTPQQEALKPLIEGVAHARE